MSADERRARTFVKIFWALVDARFPLRWTEELELKLLIPSLFWELAMAKAFSVCAGLQRTAHVSHGRGATAGRCLLTTQLPHTARPSLLSLDRIYS